MKPGEVIGRLRQFLAEGGTGQVILNVSTGRVCSIQIQETLRLTPEPGESTDALLDKVLQQSVRS